LLHDVFSFLLSQNMGINPPNIESTLKRTLQLALASRGINSPAKSEGTLKRTV